MKTGKMDYKHMLLIIIKIHRDYPNSIFSQNLSHIFVVTS